MSSKRKFEDHPTSVDSSSLKKPLIENKTIVDDAEKTKTSIRSDKKEDIVKKVPTRPVSTTPPPLLSKANDAISVSKSNKLAAVTALAIATTSKDDCPVLYSGHANGKICKWSLATNTIAWERQIFADMSEGILSKDNTPDVGIRGISINENSLGEQLIYTWSHTSESGDRSKPNKVQILRGLDGMPTQELYCEIDEMEIQPLISCVVFTKLNYNDVWEDSAIVGLQASAEVLDHDSSFTDFDLDEVEDFAYGNILPFVGEDIEETWRGHSGVIRSMASIPNKYVISCSEDPIKSFAEMIILWKADEPGVPIHQIDLRQDTLNPVHPLNYFQGGISIHKDKILLGCEMGNALVPIDILCDDDEPSIKIQGFANLGHKAAEKQSLLKGCLVGSGDTAIMNRRGCNEVHIFEISSVSKNPFLDTELIKLDKIAKEKDEKRIEDEDHSTNSMAIGRIIFPDQQSNNNTTSNSTLSSEGPEVLAMNGRWVIAGYKCGSILRSALLPEKFKNETKGLILHASTFHNCSNPNDSQIPHFDTLDHPERPDVQLPIQGLNPGAPQCVIQ